MRKYLLTIAVALALSVAAQAQETVKHIVVKNVDNTSYEIPIKSVSEISFIDETETVPVSNYIRRASSVTTSTFVAKPFSVSEAKTVYFSRGNVQYQPSTGIWSLAEHQYDIIGENNKNISDTYTGWIDLFGWGTANDPTNSSESDSAYPSFADWGARFGNGNTWYTLTNEEWAYFVRNHKNKWLKVNGVWGRVYLPDGATISIDSDWTKLEAAGAVFLPAAGCRNGKVFSNINVAGFYWSCVKYLTAYGLGLNLGAGNNWVGCADSRHQGQSVRLVRTAVDKSKLNYTVTFNSDGGSSVAKQTLKWQEKVKEPAKPTKKNFTFVGWYNGGALYDFNTPVTKNLTLKAKWIPKNSFYVSDTKLVYFSSGNLQYQPSTKTWRFAEHQYDVTGQANRNLTEKSTVWMDLFGWGTGNNPLNVSTDDKDYPSFNDWGKNIGDGKTWFTLSSEEWRYFFAHHHSTRIVMNTESGYLYLPDGVDSPLDEPLHTYHYNNDNSFTAEEWAKLEEVGAVFLPEASWRLGNMGLGQSGVHGHYYWTSTSADQMEGYYNQWALACAVVDGRVGVGSRSRGYAVRLVRLAK